MDSTPNVAAQLLALLVKELKTKENPEPIVLRRVMAKARRQKLPMTEVCDLLEWGEKRQGRHIRGPRKRLTEDRELMQRIRALQELFEYRLNIEQVYEGLRYDGYARQPGRNQVARVMRDYGLNKRRGSPPIEMDVNKIPQPWVKTMEEWYELKRQLIQKYPSCFPPPYNQVP